MLDVRVLPDHVRRELDRQESAETTVVFLTIEHAELPEPIRVVSDPRNFVLDGFTHIGFYFDITVLSDGEGPPYASLTVQNADKRVSEGILSAVTPARVKIEVIAGSNFNLEDNPCTEIGGPNTAERIYSAPHLFLTEVEANVLTVQGRLVSWDYTQELWPGIMATKNRLPGLFR